MRAGAWVVHSALIIDIVRVTLSTTLSGRKVYMFYWIVTAPAHTRLFSVHHYLSCVMLHAAFYATQHTAPKRLEG